MSTSLRHRMHQDLRLVGSPRELRRLTCAPSSSSPHTFGSLPISSLSPMYGSTCCTSGTCGSRASGAIHPKEHPRPYTPRQASGAIHPKGRPACPTMGNLGGMRRSAMDCLGVDGPTRLTPHDSHDSLERGLHQTLDRLRDLQEARSPRPDRGRGGSPGRPRRGGPIVFV